LVFIQESRIAQISEAILGSIAATPKEAREEELAQGKKSDAHFSAGVARI
jgi:hypothetical protein